MDFNFVATAIEIYDNNGVWIQDFYKTLKDKPVSIKISRKETKITRGYTLKETKLLGKNEVVGTFDVLADIDFLKNFMFEGDEVKVLEGHKIVFKNDKIFKSIELYNCNVVVKGDINLKYDKYSSMNIKAEAQGINGIYWDILDI